MLAGKDATSGWFLRLQLLWVVATGATTVDNSSNDRYNAVASVGVRAWAHGAVSLLEYTPKNTSALPLTMNYLL